MLFNSYVFMLAFLPLTLLGYFLLGTVQSAAELCKPVNWTKPISVWI